MEHTLGLSTDYGKIEIGTHIVAKYPTDISILDVGAGYGNYGLLLPDYHNKDAVEIWGPAVEHLASTGLYRNVYHGSIVDFEYPKIYDLAIFGDVIEHLTVEDTQAVLNKAKNHCRNIIVGVPYMYEQDAIYGNEAEIHLQPDLTHDIFMERYPGFELLFGKFDGYGYYVYKGV